MPLAGIREALQRLGLPDAGIRTFVRTGDTPQIDRNRMRKKPPHIVVTTPESLYILLGSESGRGMLKTTRTVIVDEIHALAPNKRGSHLALSLERLEALAGKPLLRIGLSATQKPIETVAHFLAGAGDKASPPSCTIINTGHRRARDLALEVPSSPLEAVMSAEVWEQVYDRLAELIDAHRTTLIFVNTRRLAERVTRHLSERVGADKISAHHGSLAKEHRFEAERRLQSGSLKAMVATASLELGIDIGDVDLVCQLGSPRSIAAFLQRVGRSGHSVRGSPKGAAATEDNIVLSLTTAHSFDLEDVARYLNAATVRPLLIQALLDAPMFITRWRWVAGISLALPRFRGGRKVPPQLARMGAEDLIATVFPDQLACAENLVGEREVPDHPLVNQTIADCLTDAMDIEGLERLLRGLEAGSIRVITRDLTEPSPLATEVLAARPYAYLDDAPLEERRTQAVMARRWLSPEAASDLGHLDADAISRVQAETWPGPQNADDLHDALMWLGFLTSAEVENDPSWRDWAATLAQSGRAARFKAGSISLWIPAKRLPQFLAIWPHSTLEPPISAPHPYSRRNWEPDDALVEILRGWLEGVGPVTEAELAALLDLPATTVAAALAALQSEGFALRGRFTPGAEADQWCERGLLARIHRYTTKRLRAEIDPVAARDFLRFLFDWQRVSADARMEGPDAMPAVIEQLEGFEAPAGAWESEILPARLADYEPEWLDDQCLAGQVSWARLRPRRPPTDSHAARSLHANSIAVANSAIETGADYCPRIISYPLSTRC